MDTKVVLKLFFGTFSLWGQWFLHSPVLEPHIPSFHCGWLHIESPVLCIAVDRHLWSMQTDPTWPLGGRVWMSYRKSIAIKKIYSTGLKMSDPDRLVLNDLCSQLYLSYQKYNTLYFTHAWLHVDIVFALLLAIQWFGFGFGSC